LDTWHEQHRATHFRRATNCFVDRNRAVRTYVPLAEGEEVTLNYSLLANDPATDKDFSMGGVAAYAGTLDKALIRTAIATIPLIGDGFLRALVA
jgi:hypothetical protein